MVGSESTQSTDNVISISPASVTVQLQYESDVAVGVVGE